MLADIKEFIKNSDYVKILQKLIQTNTSNPPGEEKKIVDLILSLLHLEEINFEIIDHSPNRSSLMITLPGKCKEKSIAFIGHIDTVPVSEEDIWTFEPFSGIVADNYAYGRGTADMKGGITAMLLTLQYFLQNKITPPYTLKFCFTADEEASGLGITALRDQGYLADAMEVIICEPSNCKIGICEKGTLWLNIKVGGKSCHASQPDEGVNAVEHLINYLTQLKQKILQDQKAHPLLGKSTAAITQFKGGFKANIIPDQAKATLDIRTNPGDNHEQILNTAQELAAMFTNKYSDLDITLEVENNRPPLQADANSPLVQIMTKVISDTGSKAEITGIHFYTDASQLIPYKNIPFIIIGPGDAHMAHKKDEYVQIDSIARAAEIYIRYILARGEI